jgi:hypothetical protein
VFLKVVGESFEEAEKEVAIE